MKIKPTIFSFLIRKLKLFTIMKAFIFFLCTTVFSLNTENSFSQEKVIIDEDQTVTVDKVFKIIKKQTNYRFIYPRDLFKEFSEVQLKKGEILLTELLAQSLSNNNFDFKLSDNNKIVIKKKPILISNENSVQPIQNTEVKGVVMDADGIPLIGANIIEKGTTNGSQTDFDGKYSLTLQNANATLIVSYLGYKTKEVAVSGQTTLNIALEEDSAQLEEVVIVGYDVQSQSKVISGAVAIDTEVLEKRPITNVQQALAGVDPSLQVGFGSGRPGAFPGLSLRGEGAPLVLVDGFPASINDVDPNVIETFTILKDASATAIYGLGASNGVVLITTKKGKRNSKPTFKYGLQSSIQEFTSIPELANTAEYMQLRNIAAFNQEVYINGEDPANIDLFSEFSQDVVNRALAGGLIDTNWTDLVYAEPAVQFNHSLSMSGGSERTNYNVTLGFVDQDGVNVNDEFDYFKRYNIRTRVETEVTNWLTMGANMAYTHREQVTVPTENARSLRAVPLYPVRDDDPRLGLDNPTGLFAFGDGGTSTNPVSSSTLGSFDRNRRDALEIQANLGLKLLKGLTFEQNANYRLVSTNSLDWRNAIANATLEFDGLTGEYSANPINEPLPGDRRLALNTVRATTFGTQSILKYKHKFGAHYVSGLLGYESRKTDSNGFSASRTGFINDAVISLGLGDPETETTNQNQGNSRQQSIFGRITYDYKGKYLLEASFRNDYDGQFAPGFRSGFFPGVAVGWNIHKEGFMKNVGFIDTFKINGSWGEVGSVDGRDLSYIAAVNVNNGYVFPNGTEPGLIIANYAIPNLSWETLEKTDLRLDMEFFKKKLGIYANIYQRDRKDLIINSDITDEFGLPAPDFNSSAILRLRGWELAVSHKNKIGKDFSYSIRVNASNIRQEWYKLGELLEVTTGGTIRQEGETSGLTRRYVFDGLIVNQADLESYQNNITLDGPNAALVYIGAPKFKDISGPDGVPDGIIDATYDRAPIDDDRKGVYNLGSQLNFSYKGLSLGMSLQSRFNRRVSITGNQAINHFSGGVGNAFGVHALSFDPNNPDPNAAFPIVLSGLVNYSASDYTIRDANYIRVRNINLGYTFDKGLIDQLKFFKNIEVFASIENPFYIWNDFFASDYGWDAELGFGAVDYPLPRTMTLGVNFTF